MEKMRRRRDVLIRLEEPRDYSAVYAVNSDAFETAAEANLVEALRKEADAVISMVAEEKGKIVGHIMFSPVTISGNADLKLMGLAPMAVTPKHQGKGIGSNLVKAGLEKCKEYGFGAVFVLGHTWFYPRFGFLPCARYGIQCEYDVPEDVFMVLELKPDYLQGACGTIKFHPAFKDV